MDFEGRILQFVEKNKLTPRRGLLVVGVSGGADSMALLSVLSALRHALGTTLHAAHFNHRLRPEASHDELFVAGWCKRLNVPLTVGRRTGGKIKHLSEEEARCLRFDFFVRTARSLKAQAVALAHSQNDLAETVLMRLMRGSGLYGLKAILPRREIQGVVFVRPLLGVNRLDIEKYLRSRKIPFCTDTTNRLQSYTRNRIRHQLLPLLARGYNPQITHALSDLAQTAGDDYEFLSGQARRQFDKCAVISKKCVKMPLQALGRQHPAMLRLIWRQMAEHLTHDPAALTFEHVRSLEDLLFQKAGAAVDLPHRLKAVKTQKFLELSYA